MTPSEIEPTTFQLVTQRLNQLPLDPVLQKNKTKFRTSPTVLVEERLTELLSLKKIAVFSVSLPLTIQNLGHYTCRLCAPPCKKSCRADGHK
jgi:hypothetical protein